MATDPVQIATYNNAIKVTVDGPREPRRKCFNNLVLLYRFIFVAQISNVPLYSVINVNKLHTKYRELNITYLMRKGEFHIVINLCTYFY